MTMHNTPESSEAAEALEAYVDRLLADRAADLPPGLDPEELRAYVLAGVLAGQRSGGDRLSPESRARLDARLARALATPRVARGARLRLTRRQGFTAAAGLAAGVLVGVGVDRRLPGLTPPPAPSPTSPQQVALVGEHGRWYDVAGLAEVPEGAVRRFVAGGVDGYLLHENGQVRALSSICTHMGCHLTWHGPRDRFECMCHAAVYGRDGAAATKHPLPALPPIHVRVQNGRIYAWGTSAETWA